MEETDRHRRGMRRKTDAGEMPPHPGTQWSSAESWTGPALGLGMALQKMAKVEPNSTKCFPQNSLLSLHKLELDDGYILNFIKKSPFSLSL
jgi:hypothetical protein